MKRIETTRIHNGQSHAGTRVESASGVHYPEAGWWITLGNPERRAHVAKGVTTDNRHTWDQEIWPDCLD